MMEDPLGDSASVRQSSSAQGGLQSVAFSLASFLSWISQKSESQYHSPLNPNKANTAADLKKHQSPSNEEGCCDG